MESTYDSVTIADLESALQPGQFLATKFDAKLKVQSLFLKRGDVAKFKVSRSDSKRLVCGCANSECTFRLSFNVQGDGRWKVSNAGFSHSCDKSTAVFRKRQVQTRDILPLVPTVSSLSNSSKMTQHVQQLVMESVGIHVKPGQAQSLISSSVQDATTEAFYEFQFLERLITSLAESDPTGTYLCEVEEDDDNKRRMVQTYVATSAAKSVWNSCNRALVATDATFLTGPLKGLHFTMFLL